MAYVFKQGRRTALADRRQSCARESAAEALPSCRAEDSEVKVVLTNDTRRPFCCALTGSNDLARRDVCFWHSATLIAAAYVRYWG